MNMTPRERVVAALNCRTPDRVPVVEYLFSPKLQQELLGYTTPLYDGPSQLALAHKLGLDGMWVPINGFCGLEEEVHPVERAAGMDLARVKERYRGRLCPIGNINNKTTMVTGTPEDVRREALECLRVAAPGGGYILATSRWRTSWPMWVSPKRTESIPACRPEKEKNTLSALHHGR